jgi:glycerophosphoryl diester phosphodiesterase
LAVRRSLWLSGLALLVGCTSSRAKPIAAAPCPPSPFQQRKMLVIAHAGGEGLGPANTLEAMRLSFKAGADVNDADVHITKDGVLVAMHDDTVDATTNGHGFVRDMTLAELKAIDAGYAFAGPNNDFPFRGKGVTVPTIEEILTEFPTRLTSLEFKDDDGAAPATMCALLSRLGQSKNVYISSDTDPPIDEFAKMCSGVVTTVTDAMVPALIAAQKDPNSRYCATVPIGQPPYSADRKPTVESIKWAHDHGLASFTWTVDDPDTLRYLAVIGMDAVYTTRPDIARKIVDEVTPNR